MGGLARRATAVMRERDEDPDLLLLSAGDFSGRPQILDMYTARFIAEAMADMGYTAVAIGERELNHGIRAIEETAVAELPLICANLYYEGERCFPASVVKKVNGWKIGIVAVLDENPRDAVEIELRDAVSQGNAAIEYLRGNGCDMIVLLAHMRRERLIEVLPSFTGVDLVIRGHAGEREHVSGDCADTLSGGLEDLGIPVVFAGDRGRVIGKIVLEADGDGKPIVARSEVVELDHSIPDDPDVAAAVKEFGREQAVRAREMKLKEFLARDETTGRIREHFLGLDTCRKCHAALVDDFLLSRHFRAFETLRARGEDTNPKCIVCHTTGHGQFGGYSPAREEKEGINLQGVQCEACHGQGTIHSREGAYVKTATKSCRRCHTHEWSPDFDFTTFWKRIAHCGDEHARRVGAGGHGMAGE